LSDLLRLLLIVVITWIIGFAGSMLILGAVRDIALIISTVIALVVGIVIWLGTKRVS